MKKIFFAFLMLGLNTSSVYAEVDPFVVVAGKVGNFNESSVELELKDGQKVQIPRKRIAATTELSWGKLISATVLVNEIKPKLIKTP